MTDAERLARFQCDWPVCFAVISCARCGSTFLEELQPGALRCRACGMLTVATATFRLIRSGPFLQQDIARAFGVGDCYEKHTSKKEKQ